jgi:hypothetical protein
MPVAFKKRFATRCYWCATETFPAHVVHSTHPKLRTVDHIRSKPECMSAAEYKRDDNKVIACYACNQRRSLEWCQRRDKGLVHATAWSIKEAQREKAWELRKKEAKKEREARREFIANCKPCRVIHVPVPSELEEAYRSLTTTPPS